VTILYNHALYLYLLRWSSNWSQCSPPVGISPSR